METQSGARTALVDPFGRELEEWLRDAPAIRTPYVSDLVVPPVTGPIPRPAAADAEPAAEPAPDAFRRDRARHRVACTPSFPEPPERMALRIGDLAVEVSAASGRSTIERIEFLEQELVRRDEDLARLSAWEAELPGDEDPEVAAARAYAHDAFADIIADALAETEARQRDEDRRAARVSRTDHAAPVDGPALPPIPMSSTAATPAAPVSASTRPTPLVQPATGPNAIDRAAFAEAIRTHAGTTADRGAVLPREVADAMPERTTTESPRRQGWWARLIGSLRALFARA